MSSTITVRVDDFTKKRASSIAEDFGFDLSSVLRAYMKQIVRENRIPLALEYPAPNEESLASIEEAKSILAKGDKGYASAREMFAAMEA